MHALSGMPPTVDLYYRQVSPQLLARVRQQWSARGLDLDRVWRATLGDLVEDHPLDDRPLEDSRPVDLLLLFDQAASWLGCLDVGVACARRMVAAGHQPALAAEQLRALAAVLARLREEVAAVRLLALAGLAVPAMQIIRSISEDVDMALVMLVRPKVARQFVGCRSPQEAGEFWKRHIAGGRAFRAVAEQLYRVGLDWSEGSSYALWRNEVQVLLGAAVHTSYLGAAVKAAPGGSLGAAAQECLHFATLRLQEMCVYSLMLGPSLRRDLAAGLDGADRAEQALIRVALEGGAIFLDQMRWLLAVGDDDRGALN
jgi:hypothetical protein